MYSKNLDFMYVIGLKKSIALGRLRKCLKAETIKTSSFDLHL